MAPKRIFFDKTEIVLMVPKKNKIASYVLSAKDIVRVQFDEKDSRFLGIIPQKSETITFVSGKLGAPVVYKKSQNKKYFEEYKQGIIRFVRENSVSFIDNLIEGKKLEIEP